MRTCLLALCVLLSGCAGLVPAQLPDDLAAVPVTTLRALVDGDFRSGMDKTGTNGVVVLVHNVTIAQVRNEADGDWHLNGSDATFRPFIMEIIPRDQANETKPPTHVALAVWGVPYCDKNHADAAFHGNTCWELHPVLRWQRE